MQRLDQSFLAHGLVHRGKDGEVRGGDADARGIGPGRKRSKRQAGGISLTKRGLANVCTTFPESTETSFHAGFEPSTSPSQLSSLDYLARMSDENRTTHDTARPYREKAARQEQGEHHVGRETELRDDTEREAAGALQEQPHHHESRAAVVNAAEPVESQRGAHRGAEPSAAPKVDSSQHARE